MKHKLTPDVEVEMLDGAEAGKALGMMLAHRKYAAEPVAHQLDIRARILRDITPVVSVSGPGIPAIRGKNLEWAAGEMEAAAEIIRRLANTVPRTAQDHFNKAALDKLTTALTMIRDEAGEPLGGGFPGVKDQGWCAGVAMGALADIEELLRG